MKQHFLFVRHGETDWNKEKRCQGKTDIPLNETGIEQAKELACKLHKENLSHIYASDLKRAFQTAEIIADELQIPLEKAPALQEMNHGELEGQTHVWETYADLLKIMYDNTHPDCFKTRFPKGESRQEALERLTHFLQTLPAETDNVLLVSHGNLILSLYLAFHESDFVFRNGDALRFVYDPETQTFSDLKAFSLKES